MTAHLTNCRNKAENVCTVVEPRTAPILARKRPESPLVPKPAYGAYVPRYPDPAKPVLNAERAAEAFIKMRPVNGNICPEYIKNLATIAGAEVDQLVKKLWEAVEEEGILKGEDAELALAVVAEYDHDVSKYD